MKKFDKGDIAWVLDTGYGWTQVKILKAYSDYYLIKHLDRNIAFGVSGHRLLTEEEYIKNQCKNKPREERGFRPPSLR